VRAESVALLAVVFVAACAKPDCENHPPAAPADPGPPQAVAGFTVRTVVDGLWEPTQLQFDTTGRLFVLEGGVEGPKAVRIFAPDFTQAGGVSLDTAGESTGLLVFGSGERVLVASRGRIDELDATSGGYGAPVTWIDGLPSGPEHTNNGLALGPDGFVYFGMGSTCDVCDETDPRNAAMLRAPASQSAPTPEVFAHGLRNAYDVAFTSRGELLATDNGPECCGGRVPGCSGAGPDRVVVVTQGAQLGWPDAFLGRSALPEPLVRLPVHGGVTGFAIASAPGCEDVLYVTLWGTDAGSTEAGRRVVRVPLSRDVNGALTAGPLEEVSGPEGVAHPIDVTQGPDGALYVLDYGGRVVRLERQDACP